MRNREKGFSLIELLVVVAIIMVIVAMAMPRLAPIRMSANETSAAVAVQTLNTACVTYQTLYGGYPPSLASMGPGDALASTSADLIDSALASGIKGGYRFVYSPGPKDSSGRINSYSIVAEPVDPGSWQHRSAVLLHRSIQHHSLKQRRPRRRHQSSHLSRELHRLAREDAPPPAFCLTRTTAAAFGRLSGDCKTNVVVSGPFSPGPTTTGDSDMLRINDEAPNFTAETSQGKINFHEWIGNSWAILFSHPKDFTPVCTTELGYMAGLQPEFEKRNTKIIGLSVDPVSSHTKWAADIEETQGHKVRYPMIGDPELKVAKLYGMLPAEAGETCAGRTAADNAAVRTVFVIGPDKKIKLMLSYPMSTGRNFDEVLRVIDSMQLTAKHKVATPVNWKQGDDVIILPSVPEEEAKQKYPGGWKSPKPYIRIVPQPK
jgi:prepilin-type N-terminal cleavage/methylation domain-containing protein